jgi:hypothetical protein
MWSKIVVTGEAEVRGARVIIVREGTVPLSESAADVARHAPSALVLVATGRDEDVAAFLDASLLPPGRVIGLDPERAHAVADAVARGEAVPVEATARVGGGLAAVRGRLAAGGLLLEDLLQPLQ